MSEQDIPRYRTALAFAIRDGTDTSKPFTDLLYANVPLNAKFKAINFCEILANNAQSAISLKKLIQAMSILEKYARHLMKPTEQRSNMWRHIKYSNNIFRERVNAIKGGKEIMYLMGYTESRQDGVAFPDGAEPNPDCILNLLIDLVEGRKELETFLEGKHPRPEIIEQYLTPQLLASLQNELTSENTIGSQQAMQNMVPGSNLIQSQSQPSISAAAVQPGSGLMHQTFSQSPAQVNVGTRPKTTGSNITQPSQYAEPNLPFTNQMPQRISNYPQDTYMHNSLRKQEGQDEIARADPQGNIQGQHQELDPTALQGQGYVLGRNVPDHRQFADSYRQSEGEISVTNNQGQGQSDGRNSKGTSLKSNQQFQMMQQRQTVEQGWIQNSNQPTEGKYEVETNIPSIACDICGDNHAVVICKVCDNKQLCKDCDVKWHNHPKRQKHKLERIHPVLNDGQQMSQSSEQSNTSDPRMHAGFPMSNYSMQREPGQQVQQGYSLQRKEPSGGGQFGYNVQGQEPSRSSHIGYSLQGQEQSRQTQDGYHLQKHSMSPNRDDHQTQNIDNFQARYDAKSSPYMTMGQRSNINISSPSGTEHLNSHTPGGFLYAQPSIMGHVPGTMQYPVSSGVFQHGQHPYSMAPHMVPSQVAQYPVGYLPNVFLQQQQQPQQQMSMQGYNMIPGVSAVPGMPRVDNSRSATLPRSSSTNTMTASPALVQNVRHSISSPKVTESTDTSNTSMSSVSSTSSGSSLLPKIKAIDNLEKQHSKLEINLMTLKDDLKEWEEKINEIILQNPNFFQDEEYKHLNRKKRKHLQEVKELQKYQEELELLLKEKENDETERKENEVELLKQRFNQIKTGSNDNQLANAETYKAPVAMEPMVPAPTSCIPVNSSGLVPAGPVTSTYRPDQLQKKARSSDYENCPPLHINSLGDDLPEDVKKMHADDVNTHAQMVESNLDLTLPNQALIDPNVIIPPNISNQQGNINEITYENLIGFKKGNSEPNLQLPSGGNQFQVKKSQSAADLPMWQCEHCTFLNNYDTKACMICFKTSDNPKKIDPNMPTVSEGHEVQTNMTETCEVCTVFMEPGTQICGVCGETQSKYKIVDQVGHLQLEAENQTVQQNIENQSTDREQNARNQLIEDKKKGIGNQEISGRPGNVNQSVSDTTGDNVATAASNVGKMIEEEQDQVYLEKKAARERFEKMNKSQGDNATAGSGNKNPADAQGMSKGAVGGASGSPVGVAKELKQSVETLKQEVVQEWIIVDKSPAKETPKGNFKQSMEKSPVSGDLSRLRTHSGQSTKCSSSLNTATSSLDENLEPKGKAANQMGATGKVTKAPQLNFVEAIEQINMKREQEQMSLDGHEIMSIIKEGERRGFEVPEIQIALKYSIEDKQRPLIWLQTKWLDLIGTVATMATEEGATADQNDVGDISNQEAKQALIKCEGDIEKAAKMCAQERKAKFAEINSSNQYAREDILTALYQNHGDKNEAFDQLNHSVLQSYADRLWETNENPGGDVAIAAAARSAELTNSVSNSVINHENFTRLVSDITIDKERRVRMVFVEGKLRSWGRAEMVVTILDKEVTQSENPLECTLEDIIEAVRNCGDRKSSLAYLTQTCGICYSNFPMSKIRYLGACNCKLCQSCVQGYFEVAIREKYVRNWCCPLCEAPGLEDEARASSYFEFLSLILQNLVSKEVLDLYEVKLRDWHLQKDPNFRWCAHCASGFIWDRPDVLGMTCPSCKKKTCFMCKIKWEEQHDGLSCEEYEQWKIDNDPEKQAKGVKLYLEENGIDCPSCKMRYSLAKGGCMHFKCPQCGFEFCSGCSQAFLHQGACKSCKGKGLHCHHPRDCFYFLRDEDIPDLQELLKKNKCRFNTEVPPTQEDPEHCPVMEQKEYGAQKKDEPCGKDTNQGLAGLCVDHYKEYLVSLINKHKIDPLAMMSFQQMKILIERNEKEVPKPNQNEAKGAYERRIVQFIKERWPLNR